MTRDQLIMLFHDGELDEVEAVEARELLARDADARALLANLELVSSLLAEGAAQPTSADITSQVMAQVLKEAPPKPEPKLRAPLPFAPRQRARRALAGVSLAMALAAGVALLVSRQQTGSVAQNEPEVAAPAGAISAPEPDPPEQSVAIERIDFGEDPGAIFFVPGIEERTIVVWTIDDAADNAPEIEL